MMKIRNSYDKFCQWWNVKRVAGVLLGILVISLLPLLYCSFFDYATGDDFGYSAEVHQLMQADSSLPVILKAMFAQVRSSWYSYQGTWSSIFLFQLQPGIWGERIYTVTVWIALFFLLCGSGYYLHEILAEQLGLRHELFWCVFAVLSFLSIQYIPKIRGGIFWYTSVAHYVIPYGCALWCAAWACKFLRTAQKHYFILLLFFMSYLGGAGYPPLVLSEVLVFMTFLYGVCQKKCRKRGFMLLAPMALEGIGFVISAAAPGNKNRGGSDFGLSTSRGAATLAAALKKGVTDELFYLLHDRMLIPLLLVIFVLTFEIVDVDSVRGQRKWQKHPAVVLVLGYLIICAVRTPAIYANVEVSGGVPDVEYFTSLLFSVLFVISLGVWGKEKLGAINNRNGKPVLIPLQKICLGQAFNHYIRTPVLVLMVVFILLFGRHLVGGTADYICADFVRSGQLQDFHEQMQERLAILEDESVRNAVVPQMNSEQGPFMHMPLGEDPTAFVNVVTAEYYGKESVIAVPREQYHSSH